MEGPAPLVNGEGLHRDLCRRRHTTLQGDQWPLVPEGLQRRRQLSRHAVSHPIHVVMKCCHHHEESRRHHETAIRCSHHDARRHPEVAKCCRRIEAILHEESHHHRKIARC